MERKFGNVSYTHCSFCMPSRAFHLRKIPDFVFILLFSTLPTLIGRHKKAWCPLF